MEKTYTVYRLISPNTKMYVGITCQRLLCQRWRNGTGYPHNVMLQSDIQKYGWDNFTHEAIAAGLTKSEAEEMERLLIERHNLTDSCCGYNRQNGGTVGFINTMETRHKMRDKLQGNTNGIRYPVNQYSLLGEFIARWDSAEKYAAAHGKKSGVHIRSCCQGKRGVAYGYMWRFADDVTTDNIDPYKKPCYRGKDSSSAKPVYQYNRDGDMIQRWDCATDWGILNNKSNVSHIYDCCNGKRPTAYGYKWRYVEEGED